MTIVSHPHSFLPRRPRSTEPTNPSPIPAAGVPAVGISLAAQASPSTLEPSSKRLKQGNGTSKPTKQLVQVHLDLGQKNFHSTRCPTCGLIYTPGKESDDRLHAAYHNKLASVPRYTASRGDATVATDGTVGDIVRLCTTAPTKSVSFEKNLRMVSYKKYLFPLIFFTFLDIQTDYLPFPSLPAA
jgi:hypothetical protein